MQIELEDVGGVPHQALFKAVDVVKAQLPDVFSRLAGREALGVEKPRMHPHNQDLFVIRAVEHADLTLGRQVAARPPQEMVAHLLFVGRRKAVDHTALRVHARKHVPDQTVLARGVGPLQDDEKGVFGACPQDTLGFCQVCNILAQGRARLGLVLELGAGFGPVVVQANLVARPDQIWAVITVRCGRHTALSEGER